jgi:outer membrane protein
MTRAWAAPIFAATIVSLAFAAPVSAGASALNMGPPPLTLQDAVHYALTHSANVVKQIANLSAAQAQYFKTRSQGLPGVAGSLQNAMQKSQNYLGSYSIIGAPQMSVYSQNTAQLGTSYTWNGGLSHYQTLVAQQQVAQAEAALRSAQQQVTNDVTNGYYTLASKSDAVRLNEGDLEYQSLLVQVARAKERAGVAAGVDVLSAQAQQEKSRYTLEAAKADVENARESLAQLIGAPLDTRFDVPAALAQPALPAQTLDQLIAMAETNRPEVSSAVTGVGIADTNRKSADSDLFPQIQSFASFGNQFSPTLLGQEALLGPVPRGNPGFWNIGLNTTVSLPFLDWGARRANHRDLDEQISAADSALQTTRTQVELDVRQAYRGAQTALSQLASAQEETRYALEATRIARLQYERGVIGITDVFQREQSALSAQTDLFDARVSYVTAIVKLRVALGIYTPERAVADLNAAQGGS